MDDWIGYIMVLKFYWAENLECLNNSTENLQLYSLTYLKTSGLIAIIILSVKLLMHGHYRKNVK